MTSGPVIDRTAMLAVIKPTCGSVLVPAIPIARSAMNMVTNTGIANRTASAVAVPSIFTNHVSSSGAPSTVWRIGIVVKLN